jgi:hypothetical protein
MKKLLAASVALFVSVSECMDSPDFYDEHIKYLTRREGASVAERRSEKFNTFSLDAKLLGEIGDDPSALEAYRLFHLYKFDEFLDCYLNNCAIMRPDNAEKIRELLILITPIVAESENIIEKDREFDWDNKYDEFKKTVFKFICNSEKATSDQIKFPQFCYEVLGKAMIDADYNSDLSDRLSVFLESICRFVHQRFKWDGHEIEGYMFKVVGLRENDWGNCRIYNVWPNLEE